MTQHRFNTLDGLRGVAAIAVMLTHFSQHTSFWIFSSAGLAVDLFFCLSGFVIAYSYQNRLIDGLSFKDFFIKRLVRLYPMFIFGFAIGAPVLIFKAANGQSNFSYAEAITAISLNAFYLPYLSDLFIQIGKNKVVGAIFPTNDPAWSLFFELLVNVIFAVFVLLSPKKNPLPLVLLGGFWLVGYFITSRAYAPGWESINVIGGLPRTIYGFFSGVYIFFVINKLVKHLPRVRPIFLVSLILAVFLIPSFRYSSTLWLINTLFLVPALVSLSAVSIQEQGIAQRFFDYLGWLSYPVYCLHFPIYSLFTLLTNNVDYGLSGTFFCASVTIISAHLIARYLEEPAREKLSAKLFPKSGIKV